VSEASRDEESISLARQAYYTIRDRILRGEIALGAPLSRRSLARDLGMSLLPVAEALQSLERDGLVESRPRVGTRVCLPAPDEIREQYEIREALEAQAARLYTERAPAREKRELERLAERMDKMFQQCRAGLQDREFLYSVHSFHLEFHLRIADAAACDALRDAIEKNHVLIFNWLAEAAGSRPSQPARFHGRLVAALNKGDAEAADRAMRAHVRHGLDNIVKLLGPRSEGARFVRIR
jgi:DNA-binding GntR family transcriptional regulator